MDRATWLGEKRRLAEERMDALFAPGYDERWGRIDPTHGRMLDAFLSLCPPGGSILDAACGTGKYWPTVLESGRSLIGSDHPRRMLSNAREKFPDVPIEKARLQDLRHEDAFDGVVCVDAMENRPPEDWPVVLQNFRRTLRGRGLLYLTVEISPEGETEAALVAGEDLSCRWCGASGRTRADTTTTRSWPSYGGGSRRRCSEPSKSGRATATTIFCSAKGPRPKRPFYAGKARGP